MAVINKPVDRSISPSYRTQVFTQDDAAAGDILNVETSLGHPARNTRIEAVNGDLTVRLNMITQVFNPRTLAIDDLLWTDGFPNLTSGHDIWNSGVAPIGVSGNDTLVIDDMRVKDIQIVTAGSNWKITTY